MTNFRRALLAILTFVGITAGSLVVGTGIASAWHVGSSCVNKTWVITNPNESWNSGTAALDFDKGSDVSGIAVGGSVTAPDEANSAKVSWTNSSEKPTVYRPEGCTKPTKPADGYTDRTVDGVCTKGATTVDVKVYRTPFTWVFTNGAWVKSVGAEVLFSTTPRNLTAAEQITCKPTHEPKVVTVDDGTPKCGDTSVATTTTTTTYTYTYVNGVWVEHTTDTVAHGSRPVETAPCPTTPPTTVPPTTVPPTTVPPTTVPAPCAYDTSLPADSPLCVPPTVPTLPPTTVAPTTVVPPQLPATGKGDGGLLIGAFLLAGGIIALLVARRPKHA